MKEKLIKNIKKKLFGYVLLFALLLTGVFALSDPINQSFPEYNNLTRADNFLEVTQEINLWVGGLFGITFLIIIFAVSFTISLFFRNDMVKALMFSLFITTLSSIFLFTANLVPDEAVFFCVPLFILSVVFASVKK